MKYLLILLGVTYFIGGIVFFAFLSQNKNEEMNIEKIKESIVIIVPENELISYKNNPEGLFEEYKNSGIGAGFFISKEGLIQTVNHIIENDKINYKIIYNDTEYNSQIIYRDIEQDMAILKIESKESLEIVPLVKTLNVNESEVIYSFGVDIKNLKIIYNTGTLINKKSNLDNLSNLLEISNTLEPGFSGGPIINYKGKVIGINYAISEGKKYGIKFK